MSTSPILDNEPARLHEIETLGLTQFNLKDANLNDMVRIASAVANTPVAMVNLLTRPDLLVLRACGLPDAVTRIPLENTPCRLVLPHGDVLTIEDMSTDSRTSDFIGVAEPLSLRSYAGAPLISSTGYILGTLCVLSTEPQLLNPRGVDSLRRLADHVARLLQTEPAHNTPEMLAPALETSPVQGQFHPQSSILFTDFVGFTRHAEALEPAKLLETLGRYFSAFDKLCAPYNVRKIKTIGDAFMAVSGVPAANPDHARDAVAAALAIRDYVAADNRERLALGQPAWEVRIGVHSGPVISGKLGEHGSLDIWGDSVNVASRLESAGKPSEVNISEATLAQLDRVDVEDRGVLPIKNKEPLKMYFVRGLK